MLPEYDHQILKLTAQFYSAYPDPPYKEIEYKQSRCYNCLIIQSHYDYYICVPFRSHVNHKYAFHFRKSVRSRKGLSALDYSKSIIICNPDYLDSNQGIVDSDEYSEMMQNMDIIVRQVLEYVDDYIAYIRNEDDHISKEEFFRRYKYSTLKYFHDIMQLPL